MKKLICKIFGHIKNPLIVRYTSLKRGHTYCFRCEKRIETNIELIGDRRHSKP